MRAVGNSLEEDKAASRDYGIPWWKGGNPYAVDKGDYEDIYLRGGAEGLNSLIQDKRAYNQALRDDKLFTTNLKKMTDGNYEAKTGYLALLNDPSRLNKLQKDNPIRALNYMRSITGDKSNIGFNQLEAMRAGNFEGLNLPGAADKGDYGGLTATKIANRLLPYYRQLATDMYGEGFLGNTAAANYGDGKYYSYTPKPNQLSQPDYGDLGFYGTYPSTKAGTEQLGLADDLTNFELYKMRSQAQDRGGFTGPKIDRQSVYDELYDKIYRKPSGEYMQPIYKKYFPEGGGTSAEELTNLAMADLPESYFKDYDKILSQAGLNPDIIESSRIGFKSPVQEDEEEQYPEFMGLGKNRIGLMNRYELSQLPEGNIGSAGFATIPNPNFQYLDPYLNPTAPYS